MKTITSTGHIMRAAEQDCLLLLQKCSTLLHLAQIQAQILKLGLQNNPLVLTKFTLTSSDLSGLYDTFLFNTVIRAYDQTIHLKNNDVRHYKLMLHFDVLPNKFTYPFVLKACAGIGKLSLGKQIHGSVVKFGFDDDLHAQNTLVHTYCGCNGGVWFARKVFDEMPQSNCVSWSTMIGGYARLGMSTDSVDVFRRMIAKVQPDEITMVSLLSACTDLGALELGKWIESFTEKENLDKSVHLRNAMIDMFAKCGDIDKALRLFRDMAIKTDISWTSVIVGMAMHGRVFEVASLYVEMKISNVAPDDVTFIGLLTVCSRDVARN